MVQRLSSKVQVEEEALQEVKEELCTHKLMVQCVYTDTNLSHRFVRFLVPQKEKNIILGIVNQYISDLY